MVTALRGCGARSLCIGVPDVFDISPDVRHLGLTAGVIVFRNVAVGESPPALRAIAQAAAQHLRDVFPNAADIRRSKELAGFRNVYAALGPSGKLWRPGCERLCELAWKRGDIPNINALVDAYNLVSLRYFLSLGAHDLDRLALPVQLRRTHGDERFTPLNGSTELVPAGEFAYVDAEDRLICRLDVLQGDFSKITPYTKHAFVIVEGTVERDRRTFLDAGAELIDLITRYCGGSADTSAWLV